MSSIDYLLWGNHLFVLGSVGYLIVDLTSAQLSEPFGLLSAVVYFVLAVVFLVDSVLYLRCTVTCLFASAAVLPAQEATGQMTKNSGGKGGVEHRRAFSAPDTLMMASTLSTLSSSLSSSLSFIPPSQPLSKQHSALSTTIETATASSPATVSITVNQSTVSSVSDRQCAAVPPRRAQSVSHVRRTSGVFCEHQTVARTKGALLPLTVYGTAELLNVLASLTSVCSAMLLLSSTTDDTFAASVTIDLLSATLWLIDSLAYFRAWQLSASSLLGGVWWQPASMWWWANVLNVGGSLAYVCVAVMAWMGVWVDGAGMEIAVEQSAAYVLGDVLYVLCALVCQWAWQLDRKLGASNDPQRRNERFRGQSVAV